MRWLMDYSKLKVGSKYKIKSNSNKRLNEYGLTPNTEVELVHLFNGWIYVFLVRKSKIGIRRSELNGIDFRKIE